MMSFDEWCECTDVEQDDDSYWAYDAYVE